MENCLDYSACWLIMSASNGPDISLAASSQLGICGYQLINGSRSVTSKVMLMYALSPFSPPHTEKILGPPLTSTDGFWFSVALGAMFLIILFLILILIILCVVYVRYKKKHPEAK